VFRLLPLTILRGHEEHEPDKVDALIQELLRDGELINPIWVARDTWVILNGHHRVEAFRRLGMKRIPAWIFDYDGEHVDLQRWSPGPPIQKAEVVHRAHHGPPFPPKTTRHRVLVDLPPRRVSLARLWT
jgi:hypothetical protein